MATAAAVCEEAEIILQSHSSPQEGVFGLGVRLEPLDWGVLANN